MEKEVYIKIEGRVQGIGFRWWAIHKAEEISGISGWVRNAARLWPELTGFLLLSGESAAGCPRLKKESLCAAFDVVISSDWKE